MVVVEDYIGNKVTFAFLKISTFDISSDFFHLKFEFDMTTEPE